MSHITTNENKTSDRWSVGASSGLWSIGGSLLINGLGAYVVYRLAQPHFGDQSVVPLVLSALVPGINTGIGLLVKRRIDVIAVIALVQL